MEPTGQDEDDFAEVLKKKMTISVGSGSMRGRNKGVGKETHPLSSEGNRIAELEELGNLRDVKSNDNFY